MDRIDEDFCLIDSEEIYGEHHWSYILLLPLALLYRAMYILSFPLLRRIEGYIVDKKQIGKGKWKIWYIKPTNYTKTGFVSSDWKPVGPKSKLVVSSDEMFSDLGTMGANGTYGWFRTEVWFWEQR